MKWFNCLVLFAWIIVSCAGTEITEKQVDHVYTGKPVSNMLVIAITGNEHNRRLFEQKFVAQLKSFGIEAISSEEVIPMPPDLEMERAVIMEAVNQHENDAVIITHLIDKDVEDVYSRGHRGFHGFYYSRYRYAHDTGYSSTSTTLRLETNLYAVETDNLIWSGESRAWGKDSQDKIIDDVIRAVISNLYENKLIAPN
ncbi:MAG: hypothetical protein JRI93_07060 [Deltaproteobacteria bacterium]|nr:hypothetical protein [Deltaproteobacteria bacterium]MBW2611096.1 hypothetical protein [Deltaproteobacteria bacterium]